MVRLANWCSRRRYTVLGAWLLVLAVLGVLTGVLGTSFTDSTEMPNSESATAYSLMAQAGDTASGETGRIVWHSDGSAIDSTQVRSEAQKMLAAVKAMPGVESVSNPYTKAGVGLDTSSNTAFSTVTVTDAADADAITTTAQKYGSSTLDVELGGTAFAPTIAAGGITEIIGVIAALLILLLVFRSIWAALLPILTGVVGVVTSLLAVMLASHLIDLSDSVITMGSLIGLGVGIDYALFIVNRHRKAVVAGAGVPEGIATALNTSGRAVVFAGLTVIVALLGMRVIGLNVLTGMAASAAVTVLFTVISANTLLPALLSVLKLKVLSRKQRKLVQSGGTQVISAKAAQKAIKRAGRRSLPTRWADLVQAHPIRAALAALVVIAALASPALSMRLGTADASSDPTDSATHSYYELMANASGPGFGAGVDATLLLVAETPDAASTKAFTALVKDLPQEQNVSSATITAQGNGVSVAALTPSHPSGSEETADLVTTLRDSVIPAAETGSNLHVYVGGSTATDIDMSNALMDKLPLYLILVAALGFLLLVLAFRSLLVPLLGAVSNLATIVVGLGAITAIFQFGWASELLGVGSGGPIAYLVPVMIAGVMFGLSMDYQVFLISSIHEEYHRTGDNRRAIRSGITETAGVIIAAATIMLAVFSSFGFSGERIVASIGIGMAIAVVIDAFVVRLTLMPALLTLFGRANWYYPRPLAAITPNLTLENSVTETEAVPEPEPVYSYSGSDEGQNRWEAEEGTWKRV